MKRLLMAMLAMMMMAGLLAGVAPRVAHAGEIDGDMWIEVSGTKPTIGCAVDLGIELRSEGQPLGGADVLAALHTDADGLISMDEARTSDVGIVHLSIDTSLSPVGVTGWIDINVGGKYFTGIGIKTTEDGGCSNEGKSIHETGTIAYYPVSAPSASGSDDGLTASVWVPRYQQQRPLSCEYASLFIATSAFGNGVSEYAFDDLVGWSDNPFWGYRGDIWGKWGNTIDYGVYAEPLVAALDHYGYRGEVFYGNGHTTRLTEELDAGHPVVVWISMWGDQTVYYETDGVTYPVVAGEHVVVAYGYDENGIYISDPGTGVYKFYTWGDFKWMWNVLGGMSLAVSPY